MALVKLSKKKTLNRNKYKQDGSQIIVSNSLIDDGLGEISE